MSYRISLRTNNPALSSATVVRVDQDHLRITGINAMTAGVEAIGHGLATDQRTIQMMANLAAERAKPIRSRFGHPGISEQSMGRQIGNTGNYRVMGNQLHYDLDLIDAARTSPAFAQDPIEYILRMAIENPADIATSVVIDTGAVWVLQNGAEVEAFTEEGSRVKRPENATSRSPIMRPIVFHYTDLVQEGAVTHDGLFSQKLFTSGVSSYAEQLFSLADQWRLAYGIPLSDLPKKINQLLVAYTHSRTTKGSNHMPTEEQEEMMEVIEVLTPTNQALDNAENLVKTLSATEEKTADSPLWSRVQGLEEQVARLSTVLEQVVTANITMRSKIKSLEGEPFADARVPHRSPTAFGRSPNADLWQEVPAGVDDRAASQPKQPKTGNPTVNAMQRQVQRQARMNTGNR